MNKRLYAILIVIFMLSLAACGFICLAEEADHAGTAAEAPERIDIQILATSDLHGKFVPYDYALNAVSDSGSLAQVATFISENRNDHTLVIDCGDLIQGNSAELFLADDLHPMVQGLNLSAYDVWVAGNHDFNFGLESLKHIAAAFDGTFLCGNVYNPDGSLLGANYIIREIAGVKVAVIGMVTPHIARWDAQHLTGYTVTDPVAETRRIIDEIQNEVDVIIAVAHMGEYNEYDTANSGVYDLADACPEIDLIVAAHDHKRIAGLERNGVLIVENASDGKSVAQIILTVARDAEGHAAVVNRSSASISMADYAPAQDIVAATAQADARAKEQAEAVIGRVVNGPLAPENEIPGLPQARLEPSALINLINAVQMYYTGAEVSAAALFIDDANLENGDIRYCDVSLIYPYTNTLYRLEMNGAQLKRYMEWSASYYNQYRDGDLTISFNPDSRGYLYDMFYGVNYRINIARPVGERIEHLTWPDGTPVANDDVFTLAVNNYRVVTQLCSYGTIFQESDVLPKVLEIDVRGDLGGIRELIADYIVHVKNGVIDARDYDSLSTWEIVGNDWDEALHAKAVQMLKDGKLSLVNAENGREVNTVAITVEDLEKVE
ncbi:MAG: 5'-nucleotidase C-terminal domain-containing protein [Aristaeellaceae bacterium]